MNESHQSSVDNLQIRTDNLNVQTEVLITALDPTFNDADPSETTALRSRPVQEVSRLSEQEKAILARSLPPVPDQSLAQPHKASTPQASEAGYTRPQGRSNEDAVSRAQKAFPRAATKEAPLFDLDVVSKNMTGRAIEPSTSASEQQIASSIRVSFDSDKNEDPLEEPTGTNNMQSIKRATPSARSSIKAQHAPVRTQEKPKLPEKDPSDILSALFDEPEPPKPEVYTVEDLEELKDILSEEEYQKELAKLNPANVSVEAIQPQPEVHVVSTPALPTNEPSLYEQHRDTKESDSSTYTPVMWPAHVDAEINDPDITTESEPLPDPDSVDEKAELILQDVNNKFHGGTLICITDAYGKPLEDINLGLFSLAMEISYRVSKDSSKWAEGKHLFSSLADQDIIAKLTRNLTAVLDQYEVKSIPHVHLRSKALMSPMVKPVIDAGLVYYKGGAGKAYRVFYVSLLEDEKGTTPLCLVLIENEHKAVPLQHPTALWIQ